MKPKGSRQLVLLAVLGVLVVAALARRTDSPTAVDPRASNGRQTAATSASQETPVADLRLDLLKGESAELGPTTRNPFQFKSKPEPPAAAQQASAPKAPVVVAPPPLPQGPPPPPTIGLKYIGVLETAQGRVAIFRDTGGDIVNGREGDIIDGRYRLLKIGVESADLAYVDGRGRQTIRLSGQ
jgi:hypothetical protein